MADILVGEFALGSKAPGSSRAMRLLAVDMSEAEIKERDEGADRRDHPALSGGPVGTRQPREDPAVGHQVLQLDPAGRLASGRLRRAIEQQAMRDMPSGLVERAAGTEENKAAARAGRRKHARRDPIERSAGRCSLSAGNDVLEARARAGRGGPGSRSARGVLAVRSAWHGHESRRGPERPVVDSQNSQNTADRVFLRILRIVSSGGVSPARRRLRKPGPYCAMGQPASAERVGRRGSTSGSERVPVSRSRKPNHFRLVV